MHTSSSLSITHTTSVRLATMASFYVPLPPLDDDANQSLFADLGTTDALTPDRPVSPVNMRDLVDLDAIP
jgi:hypothetical protein